MVGLGPPIFYSSVFTNSAIAHDTGLASNGRYDSPAISADGRFVAYRSFASNLVPGAPAGVAAIFLFGRLSGANILLSSGAERPNRNSALPVFSGDGRVLFFQSLAANLASNDLNRYSDVFALRFLYATILAGPDPGQGPWLSWPWVPGRNYQVEFKDNPGDATWQRLTGSFTNSAGRAWLRDSTPGPNQRVYRINAN